MSIIQGRLCRKKKYYTQLGLLHMYGCYSSRPRNSFTTWAALSQAFLSKYFPPGKTAKLRNDITSFFQLDDEPLYEAWEYFKDL